MNERSLYFSIFLFDSISAEMTGASANIMLFCFDRFVPMLAARRPEVTKLPILDMLSHRHEVAERTPYAIFTATTCVPKSRPRVPSMKSPESYLTWKVQSQ